MSDVKADQTAMDLGAETGGLESVEKFQFAPIKGYPMLNWRGKRPFTSPYRSLRCALIHPRRHRAHPRVRGTRQRDRFAPPSRSRWGRQGRRPYHSKVGLRSRSAPSRSLRCAPIHPHHNRVHLRIREPGNATGSHQSRGPDGDARDGVPTIPR